METGPGCDLEPNHTVCLWPVAVVCSEPVAALGLSWSWVRRGTVLSTGQSEALPERDSGVHCGDAVSQWPEAWACASCLLWPALACTLLTPAQPPPKAPSGQRAAWPTQAPLGTQCCVGPCDRPGRMRGPAEAHAFLNTVCLWRKVFKKCRNH